MPSSRINCWIARPLAQPPCPWGVLWMYCNSTEWESPLFQVEDKGLLYFLWEYEKRGKHTFLAPAEMQRKDTYMPDTGPVHGTYNWALDRTTRARGLIYNRCVRTKRGLKCTYATSHLNVGIYNNKLSRLTVEPIGQEHNLIFHYVLWHWPFMVESGLVEGELEGRSTYECYQVDCDLFCEHCVQVCVRTVL